MRPATPEEIDRWDELVAGNPDGGNPLQGRAFAETKAAFGWRPHYLVADRLAVLALARQVPLLGTVWYMPSGPGVTDAGVLQSLSQQISEQTQNGLFLKLESQVADSPAAAALMEAAGGIKVPDIQLNRATVMVDLDPPEADIIASFKQKTRYNIRLAERNGVTVSPVTLDQAAIDTMYHLIAVTKDRAGFFLRPKAYFERFWREHAQAGSGQLFFARHDGQVVAGAFMTYVGATGLYKDGGSVRERSNTQAAYLLQWEAMRWLKTQGVTRYDLHGVPPEGSSPNHPLSSLVQFKSGFGPTLQTLGAWDIPLNKANYAKWQRFGQRLMLGLLRRLRQDLFY